jgi:hypothetical protein
VGSSEMLATKLSWHKVSQRHFKQIPIDISLICATESPATSKKFGFVGVFYFLFILLHFMAIFQLQTIMDLKMTLLIFSLQTMLGDT